MATDAREVDRVESRLIPGQSHGMDQWRGGSEVPHPAISGSPNRPIPLIRQNPANGTDFCALTDGDVIADPQQAQHRPEETPWLARKPNEISSDQAAIVALSGLTPPR